MAMQSGFIKRIRDIMRMDAGINGDAQRIEQMVWMLFLKVYDAKEDDWELNEDNYESIIPEDLRWRNWAKADENGHAMTGDKLLINPAVVYPHSFRHRFAKSFLDRCNDIAFLADLMGHESIETTRIYLRKTATEQREIVDTIIDW